MKKFNAAIRHIENDVIATSGNGGTISNPCQHEGVQHAQLTDVKSNLDADFFEFDTYSNKTYDGYFSGYGSTFEDYENAKNGDWYYYVGSGEYRYYKCDGDHSDYIK